MHRKGCTRASLGTLQALQAQSEKAFWPGLHSLYLYDGSDVLDATAKFSVRPARGVKDQERTRLARAFSMASGIIGVHARVKGAEPTMKRLINKVASRLMTVKPNGDVEPLRETFYPEELHFAAPTCAVAKAITECVVKTKMQLAVFSKQPGDESTETQCPWAWDGMSLAKMRSPVAEDEYIPHEIEDHDVREAWAAAFVASAKADGAELAVDGEPDGAGRRARSEHPAPLGPPREHRRVCAAH